MLILSLKLQRSSCPLRDKEAIRSDLETGGISFCKVNHSKKQNEREEERGWFFFRVSAQFPFYFLPEDPCLQNVQSMLSMDRLWNAPEKERKKSSSMLQCKAERQRYYPENPPAIFFSYTFYHRVSGTLSYFYNQKNWITLRLAILTQEKKKHAPCSKCLCLSFCAESC